VGVGNLLPDKGTNTGKMPDAVRGMYRMHRSVTVVRGHVLR